MIAQAFNKYLAASVEVSAERHMCVSRLLYSWEALPRN
jgi:hypothetical protein